MAQLLKALIFMCCNITIIIAIGKKKKDTFGLLSFIIELQTSKHEYGRWSITRSRCCIFCHIFQMICLVLGFLFLMLLLRKSCAFVSPFPVSSYVNRLDWWSDDFQLLEFVASMGNRCLMADFKFQMLHGTILLETDVA